MEFKVGDRVKQIRNVGETSPFVIITRIDNGIWHIHDGYTEVGCSVIEDFELIKEGSMYNDLKQRIENLQNGWDKEADDILGEISIPNTYYLHIKQAGDTSGEIIIANYDITKEYWESGIWSIGKSCEKMKAFKSALLWLLDHSDIKKDEKQDKIDALKKQVDDLQRQIEELK